MTIGASAKQEKAAMTLSS